MPQRHIYVLGAGAVGIALAGSLAQAGKPVTLVRTSAEGIDAYQQQVSIQLLDHELNPELMVTSLDRLEDLDGIVVVCTKAFVNEGIADNLLRFGNSNPIVVFQNGLKVEDAFVQIGHREVYRSVVFVTSDTTAPFKIRYRPVAHSPVGGVSEQATNVEEIVDQLQSPHLIYEVASDIQKQVWEKVIMNCVYNSICPLLEVDNGIFHRDPDVFELAKKVVDECVEVAALEQISLDLGTLYELVLFISKASDGQLISTYQDINNRRPTEMDALNFAVARLADNHSAASKVILTRMLGDLVQKKADIARG